VRLSTIAKQSTTGSGSAYARALGGEVRRRRRALGLSQSIVSDPLTRGFLSSVEAGRTIPSIPSLVMIARRLHTTAAAILESVDRQLEGETDGGSKDQAAFPRRG
jgi:transcriptional regulator with XRE-family HTH domain